MCPSTETRCFAVGRVILKTELDTAGYPSPCAPLLEAFLAPLVGAVLVPTLYRLRTLIPDNVPSGRDSRASTRFGQSFDHNVNRRFNDPLPPQSARPGATGPTGKDAVGCSRLNPSHDDHCSSSSHLPRLSDNDVAQPQIFSHLPTHIASAILPAPETSRHPAWTMARMAAVQCFGNLTSTASGSLPGAGVRCFSSSSQRHRAPRLAGRSPRLGRHLEANLFVGVGLLDDDIANQRVHCYMVRTAEPLSV